MPASSNNDNSIAFRTGKITKATFNPILVSQARMCGRVKACQGLEQSAFMFGQ
jgi:hypothetical protein